MSQPPPLGGIPGGHHPAYAVTAPVLSQLPPPGVAAPVSTALGQTNVVSSLGAGGSPLSGSVAGPPPMGNVSTSAGRSKDDSSGKSGADLSQYVRFNSFNICC